MGLIVDDEDAVDSTEEQDNTEVSLKDTNAPNFSTPEEMFEILASKTIKVSWGASGITLVITLFIFFSSSRMIYGFHNQYPAPRFQIKLS